jgi:hypothetical protein
MKLIRLRKQFGSQSGQGLFETAVLIPLMLPIALNDIDLGSHPSKVTLPQ